MRELVGHCTICGKSIYCENGFLNGYTDSSGKLSCFDNGHLEEGYCHTEGTETDPHTDTDTDQYKDTCIDPVTETKPVPDTD